MNKCVHCGAPATYDSPEDLCEAHWYTTFWLKNYSPGDLRRLLPDSAGAERTAVENLLAQGSV